MRFIAVFLLCMLTVFQAYAGCYTMKEAEAEQGIRIHSELMVIGLNCQHLWPKNQKNLYLQYRQFTDQHASIFEGYENTLINFYRREGSGNAETKLHALRTDFANKIAKDAAVMRPDAFCSSYAPRIPKASAMNDQQLRKWASTIFPSHPVSRALCAN